MVIFLFLKFSFFSIFVEVSEWNVEKLLLLFKTFDKTVMIKLWKHILFYGIVLAVEKIIKIQKEKQRNKLCASLNAKRFVRIRNTI